MAANTKSKTDGADFRIPDLSGKVILVTGGNSGLGKESILQLAKHNPQQIFLTARSTAKAEEAIQDIKTAVPHVNVSFVTMDLACLNSVKEGANDLLNRVDRLDILMANAGIMNVSHSKTQ